MKQKTAIPWLLAAALLALLLDIVQMANAVDLAALYAGKKYYTERGALEEAIALNTVENEAEFISWGVVYPQRREE
ncbi:MAG: hypothetical protein LBS57_02320 [Treponema sp.]|jgi:hypothetical protein|nr:hypothetical protein [Treponema sp.]